MYKFDKFELSLKSVKTFSPDNALLMMLSLNDYGSVWTQCDMDGFSGPPPSQMTTLILYLSDQLTACPSLWKRPSHPQGHTYCPPALPGHCPRNMSLSVCTWKSKAQVMSPLLTRVHYNWKPWPFTFQPFV